MNFKVYICGKNDQDRRIDKVIRILAKDLPLSQIYKGLRNGLIKVNEKKVKNDYKIQENDKIFIAEFLLEEKNDDKNKKNSLANQLPDIIFQNAHILILNKRENINVQKAHKNEISLDEIVKDYYRENFSNDSLSFTPGPLHRLDKNTSGLICFSLSLQAARWFSSQIQNHNIQKKYRGIVEGNLLKEETWQDNLDKDESNTSTFTRVKISEENGKNAITKVIPLRQFSYKNKDLTYVEFDIKTGRQHQIRAQSSYHNYPLFADTAYGGTKIDKKDRFFLHAYQLTFPENDLNIPNKITAPLPPKFLNFLG